MCVCICGFCNVWVYVFVGMVICGYVYVWIFNMWFCVSFS